MSLELRSIKKAFGKTEIVKDASLKIEEGEFLVLLGPSGCGKTTLLRMVAGLEDVTGGEIYIGENEITNVLPKYRDIAMVFQSYALYPHMTVRENIGYPLLLRKVEKDEREEAVVTAAKKVQLEDYLERYPKQLSGGQRQRVALARAIVRKPKLFLMDEPLSNLDAKLRGHMRAELKHLQKELGITTVYVTHDQIEAMTLADKVAVINAGNIEQLDTPRNIYNDPKNLFVASFVGSPQMNFVPGQIDNGIFSSHCARVSYSGHKSNSNALMGVRPEDLTIVKQGDADIEAAIYSIELTGDETIVTCQLKDAQETKVIVRMDADFDKAINADVKIKITGSRVFFFDQTTGNRI